MTGFVRTKGLLPWRRYYLYLDKWPWMGDRTFAEHGLRVHFIDGFEWDGFPFTVVYVRLRKADEEKFLACMSELATRMTSKYGMAYVRATGELEAIA